jgi:hypothetical protein
MCAIYIYNIRTLSVNIKFICTSFRNGQNSEPSASFSGLFCSEYKWILYLATMCVYCVYPAMSKKSENLSDLNKKNRNKRHSSPFINVVKGVFFVVRVTLVPVSYLSAPPAVHSYRVPGKFIRRLKSLFVKWKVYSSTTNKANIYSYSIFVQQMYWLQDNTVYSVHILLYILYTYYSIYCTHIMVCIVDILLYILYNYYCLSCNQYICCTNML